MRTQLEALQEVRDRISYFCARTDGRYEPAWAKEIVGIIDDVLKSPRLRNCDKFPDVDEAYDQFMNYVKRENPSFTKASPLHTVWDALKWVLDGEKKEADA